MNEWLYLAKKQNKNIFYVLFQLYNWNAVTLEVTSLPRIDI